MKNEWIRFGVLVIGVGMAIAQVAAADDVKPHPCKKIEEACVAGGFTKDGHKNGKGLWKDCIQPVLGGKTVGGVTVSADDLTACKAKREKK